MKLKDRTFIISGGSSGLGLATAKDLLSAGSYIFIVDVAPPPEDLYRVTATSGQPRVKYLKTDITKVEEIENAVEMVVAWTRTTGANLGGVVNCAGIVIFEKMVDRDGKPHSLDKWNHIVALNLTGTFNLTRLALRHLVQVPQEETPDKERGVVILVSSSTAFEGQPGQSAYAASKGAINSMVLPLSRDLARHFIRVVAIAPGPFSSPMTDQFSARATQGMHEKGLLFPSRYGDSREFAQTVRWALECSYVNGEYIKLTAGGRVPAFL